ncbi:protein ROOT INITIATION DEFECTIVE 3 isoform X2 [Medicago truncatula]|nr:protein ROOT INITIATION DEFECTIVE 3 isoform X2 [Medicago truncatula]
MLNMQQVDKRKMVVEEGEALVACSDKSMRIGVTIWDMETGEKMLHIPTCASPPLGMLCLRNRFLVASQLNKHGSVGGGAIVVWPLNKPQQPLLNYTVEAIGPLSCTKEGIYLVGGALSGTAYIWDVTSGKLLKTWTAHYKSVDHIIFSNDDSLLISGSIDGMICVWSMISLLDVEETESSNPLLHCLSGHMSSITGLLATTCSCFSILISSSLDGTCKVWDFITGRLMQTQGYPLAITCITLHQGEHILFCGAKNGTIIVNMLDIGLEQGPNFMIREDKSLELTGHMGAITAMASSRTCLISSSEDCTICIWDVIGWTITRRFDLQKWKVTNLVVIPRSPAFSASNNTRELKRYIVSPLDKCPLQISRYKETTTLLSLCRLFKEKQTYIDLRSTGLLRQNMFGSQKTDMPMTMTIEMKVETNIENRSWGIKMAKHVIVMNRQLKSRLLDMIRCRLLCTNKIHSQKTARKKLKIKSISLEGEN